MKRAALVSPTFVLVHVVALHLFVAWFLARGDLGDAAPAVPDAPAVTAATTAPKAAAPDPLDQYTPPIHRPGALDLARMYRDEDNILADLGHGWTAELTTDAELQARATAILNRAKVPFGAVVVLDPRTGDVLTLADRYDERHAIAPKLSADGPPHLALRALAPSASIFKLVTAVGLLEEGGVSSTRAYPHATAKRRLRASHLGDLASGAPRATLEDGVSRSNNGLIGRLADKKLERETLEKVARRFAFNSVVPFPLLTDPSTAQVPRNALERARMAAGFWHSRLTPLHGALIAAAIARDGTMPSPRLVRRLRAADGRIVDAPRRDPLTTAMQPATARALRKMMAATITEGTGRRAFQKWPTKKVRRVPVAGKTGSLARARPYTSYTWFVGFAPADDPQIAIAVMVGNSELWWQRATDVARDVLAAHFELQETRAEARTLARK